MLGPLERNERLLLGRIRKCKTQAVMARDLNMDYTVYRLMERGLMEIPDELLEPYLSIMPSLTEQCVIARHREDLTQVELARIMGISRGWLIQMERGDGIGTRLIRFWKKRLAAE